MAFKTDIESVTALPDDVHSGKTAEFHPMARKLNISR